MQNCSSLHLCLIGLGSENRWIMCITWDVKPPQVYPEYGSLKLTSGSSASPCISANQGNFKSFTGFFHKKPESGRKYVLLPKYLVAKH